MNTGSSDAGDGERHGDGKAEERRGGGEGRGEDRRGGERKGRGRRALDLVLENGRPVAPCHSRSIGPKARRSGMGGVALAKLFLRSQPSLARTSAMRPHSAMRAFPAPSGRHTGNVGHQVICSAPSGASRTPAWRREAAPQMNKRAEGACMTL